MKLVNGDNRINITFDSVNITVEYPNNYLLETLEANIIAFTLFDRYYPVRTYKNNVSVISVRLYNKNFGEINVKNLEKENRIKLFFSNQNNATYYCYFYDYNSMNFFDDGIETETINNSTVCYSDHLRDFIRLSIEPPLKPLKWWIILCIIIGCLIIIIVVSFFIFKVCRNKNKDNDHLIDFQSGTLLMNPED